jgi:hypothetical protein
MFDRTMERGGDHGARGCFPFAAPAGGPPEPERSYADRAARRDRDLDTVAGASDKMKVIASDHGRRPRAQHGLALTFEKAQAHSEAGGWNVTGGDGAVRFSTPDVEEIFSRIAADREGFGHANRPLYDAMLSTVVRGQ